MLSSLYIQNYALINKLQVDFHKGLNIITGETGAGKSILLGALGLVLGNRADTSVLKSEDKKCVVEAEFILESETLKALFKENDIDYDTHSIIRREINPNGKSRAFINDTPVNLSLLNEIALLYIDIHSQHQNRQINTQSFWLTIIDKVSHSFTHLAKYQSIFKEFKIAESAYSERKEAIAELTREREFIEHQFNELKTAEIEKDQLIELEEELAQQEHIEEIKSGLSASHQLLSNDLTGDLTQLSQVKGYLEKIGSVFPLASELSQRIDSIYIELKDINAEIENSIDKIDFTPERLSYLQDRVSLFYNLFTKYKVENQEALVSLRDKLSGKLSDLEDGDYNMQQLKDKADKLYNHLNNCAEELTKQRLTVTENICTYVEQILADLGMPDSKLDIQHEKAALSIDGQDKFRFLFSANKNIAANDIHKIASGGELSRLMLAIKSLVSNTSGLPTIIFDEIDTGVSGEIAHKMGNIIRNMANGMQVINITHLPQVASKGDAHFLVHKNNTSEIATTEIKQLDEKQRLQEIAKMLSGEEITDAALAHARILLNS